MVKTEKIHRALWVGRVTDWFGDILVIIDLLLGLGIIAFFFLIVMVGVCFLS